MVRVIFVCDCYKVLIARYDQQLELLHFTFISHFGLSVMIVNCIQFVAVTIPKNLLLTGLGPRLTRTSSK